MTLVSEPTGSLDQALAHASRLLPTHPALAGEQATEILKVVQDHPGALLVLGASLTARGKPRQATEILEKVAAAQPKWALAQLELA